MIGELGVQPEVKRKDAVASVAGHLLVLTTGDHALLRRMFLTNKPAADGVVIKLLLYAGLKQHEYGSDYTAWRALIHMGALLSGTGKTNPHDPKRGFGTALREAGYPESRFLRLTAARGDALTDQVVLAGRMLSKKSRSAFNLWTPLLLIKRDPEKAERARLRTAQDYYSA